jgi:shikimate dehydrogenase
VKRLPGRLVLLGHPVAHSLSPRFQNAALAAAHIPLVYEAVDVEPAALEQTLITLRAARGAGNVTVPHKTRVFAACDDVSNVARRAGAVNTFWIDDDGRLVGDNTDVGGFDAAVRTLLGATPSEITVGVIGAGGAAAAVLAAIEHWNGCTVHVYNRTPERARLLCERFGPFAQPVDDIGAIGGAQLVVNATTIGLHHDGLPIDPALVTAEAAVVDLVYRPERTAFVRLLEGRGVRAIDGLEMLVEQGALAFERWFGQPPDRSAMWRSLANS